LRRVHAVAMLAVAFSFNSEARICSPTRAEKDEGLQYVTNLIDSFSWAKEGLAALPDFAKEPQNVDQVIGYVTAYMVGLKRASENYECAATLVEPYTTSKNRPVQISATGTASSYRALISLNSQFIKTLKDILNGSKTSPGVFADKMSDFAIQADKAWEQLLNGTAAATFAVVVFPKEKEVVSTLTMTAAQRKQFDKRLEEIFGEALKKDMKGIDTTFEGSGWVLYEFINRPQWKLVE